MRCERVPARTQLIQHDAEREDIGRAVYGFPARLFRRHVPERAGEHAHLCGGCFCRGLRRQHVPARQSEIEEFHHAVIPDHDVFRFDVAMNEADRMGESQRLRDLRACFGDCFRRLRSRHRASERSPADQLHHQVIGSDVEYRADVRMVQGG